MSPHGEQNGAARDILSRILTRGESPSASTEAMGWAGIHAAILEGRIADFLDLSATCTVLLFVLKGETSLDWRRGHRFTRQELRPGDVLIAPPADCNRIRTGRDAEILVLAIGRETLAGIVEREWSRDATSLAIAEGLNRDDEPLWDLGRRLAGLIRDPVPGSRVYAEALQTQIAVHLLWNHSSLVTPADDAEVVADHRLTPVIRYIRENLAEDVSLETLAAVAGLSPNYFLGAFREATGRTPHRYVTELRVARACELLRDPHRPITDVSQAVGFSSQSHLTEVFRRTLKTTPAAYRRAALGVGRNGDGADV